MSITVAVKRVAIGINVDVTVSQEVHLPDILLKVPLSEPVLVTVAHAVSIGVLRVRVRSTQ